MPVNSHDGCSSLAKKIEELLAVDKLNAAFHETGHAAMIWRFGGTCDLRLTGGRRSANGKVVLWGGVCETTHFSPKLMENLSVMRIAGLTAEYLRSDLHIAPGFIVDEWEDGVRVPSTTDLIGLPTSRNRRIALVAETVDLLQEEWCKVELIAADLYENEIVFGSRICEITDGWRLLG